MREDLLRSLLPGADADEMEACRRAILALRLLRDDARVREGGRFAPALATARAELERLERREVRRALETLLASYLAALARPQSFLDLRARPGEPGRAWCALLGGRHGVVLAPPAPLEPPETVVDRLIQAGRARGLGAAWCALWSARMRHATAPPAEAERYWEALAREPCAIQAGVRVRAEVVAGWVAARLDRGHPRQALALIESAAELVPHDAGLRRLLGWSALLCGDLARAITLLEPIPAASRVPAALAEVAQLLGDRLPDGLRRALARADAAPSGAPVRACARAEVGARLVAVVARRRGEACGFLALDADAVARREASRRLAWLAQARIPGGTTRCLLGLSGVEPLLVPLLEETRALAVAPFPGAVPGGEAWLQVECDHFLLPDPARLLGLAGSVCPGLAGRLASARETDAELQVRVGLHSEDDPRHTFAGCLLESLGALDEVRGWWITAADPGVRVRAERGRALSDWSERRAPAAGLRQALREGRAVRYGHGPGALHARAAAGLALPLVGGRGERVLGVLLLEAARVGALTGALEARARAGLARLAERGWAAAFRGVHRERHGLDLAWDPAHRFPSGFGPERRAALAAVGIVMLVGRPGSGRRTLARRLAFGRPGGARPVCEHVRPCGCRDAVRILALDELGRAARSSLARDPGVDGCFLLAECARPSHEALPRALERHLAQAPVFLPPLADRRDEIPDLVQVTARNAERRHGLALTCFPDASLADLWRQDWEGGIAQLVTLVDALVLRRAGGDVRPADVRQAFAERGLAFRARLLPRRTRALDVRLALESTRHRVGSRNLARAARYLGWDVQTLAAHPLLGAEEREVP